MQFFFTFQILSTLKSFANIRSFQIKNDRFCGIFYKNSYLEIRKSNFYVKKLTTLCSFRIFIKFLQNLLYFFISFDGIKLKKLTFKKKEISQSNIKYVKACSIQKQLLLDFFAKYFLQNVKNKLFLGEEFDFWQNFKVTPVTS